MHIERKCMINMDSNEKVLRLEEEIGYKFNNAELLLEAVTHSSYTNEMKINKRPCYERLEFLGDAVLELISSEFLYEKYPLVPEGGLSKKRASMVCESSLAICAREMQIGQFIFFGKGEEAGGGRDRESILADVVEAILGAVYLDGGLVPAKSYVYSKILNRLTEDELFVDSKTALQELTQKYEQDKELSYRVLSESGPEHDKKFTVGVFLGEEMLAAAIGHTKKAAQQAAANLALEEYKKINQ